MSGSKSEESDLSAVQSDLAALKRDVASLLEHLKLGAGNAAQSTAAQLDDSAREIYGNIAAEGRRSLKAIGDRVESQPVAALLIALGVGYISGRLLSR